jgi:hypothetical protein
MKNFRTSVFETNSSSTHSISIYNATKGVYDTIVPMENGVIELTGGDFGWEWEKYNDALTKANYAALFAQDDKAMTDMLVEVIKEHTGAKEIDLSQLEGYIDHQSDLREGGDAHKAFDTPQILKNWLFHPESWLFTGNDNDSDPPNFYDVEFGIMYTHEVSIEGVSLSEKTEDVPEGETLGEIISRLMAFYPESDYKFFFWERKINGVEYNGLAKLKDGFITLYKTEFAYDKKGNYLGESILDSKDIKLTIKKI